MIVKSITYGKLISTGDYGNVHASITLELDEKDDSKHAFDKAKRAILCILGRGGNVVEPTQEELNHAKAIIERHEGISEEDWPL